MNKFNKDRNKRSRNSFNKRKKLQELLEQELLEIENINEEDEDINECSDSELDMLIPFKIPNPNIDPKDNDLIRQGFLPKLKESVVFCGGTGSGKSNLILWLLLNPNAYKDMFDSIYLFSPTAHIDPMFKLLKLKKKNMVSTNILEELTKLINRKKDEVKKKGIKRSKCDLILIEDSSSESKLLHSPILVKAFTMLRHFGCSLWVVIHSIKTLRPTQRANSNHVILFPCSKEQQLIACEQYCDHLVNKKTLLEMFSYCNQRTEKNQRPFLYINNKCDKEDKFRKGFHEILRPN